MGLRAGGAALIVASWNIHRGLSALFRPSAHLVPRALAEIGADLVALQEAQIWGRPGLALLDEAALRREAGLRALRPSPGTQGFRGNVLLASERVELRRGPTPLPLGGWEPRGALVAEVAWGGKTLRVACAHLSLGAGDRRRQAELLLGALAGAPRALLLADLNETRGDALGALRSALPSPPSPPGFPSFRPALAHDHALGSAGLVAEVWVHETKPSRAASDHLPLVARLTRDATKPR